MVTGLILKTWTVTFSWFVSNRENAAVHQQLSFLLWRLYVLGSQSIHAIKKGVGSLS